MSQSPIAVATPRRIQTGRGQVLATGVLGLLFLLAVLFFSVMYFGFVSGQEFSPDDFTRRKFSFYELPLLGWQVTPIDRSLETNALESFLTSEKLVKPSNRSGDKQRWDLVFAARGVNERGAFLVHGDARVLCAYLDAQDTAKNFVWLEWSKKNKELAKILWPTIAKLAQQELYVFAPELLVAARGLSDAVALQSRIDAILAKRYVSLAQTQQLLGRHDAAVELFGEAIQHAPQLADAFAGRAKSLTVLGRADKASADLAAAKQFGSRL